LIKDSSIKHFFTPHTPSRIYFLSSLPGEDLTNKPGKWPLRAPGNQGALSNTNKYLYINI